MSTEKEASDMARAELMHKVLERGQPMVSSGGCEVCGHLPASGLLRCSRCLKVRYCSASCQKGHWARHKGECVAYVKPTLKEGTTGFVDMTTRETHAPRAGSATAKFRNLACAPPTNVRGCCYCCGILLKRTADPGNSVAPDAMGVFWTRRPHAPGFGPTDAFVDALVADGGVVTRLEQGPYVGVCLTCARALNDESTKGAHLDKCKRWLRVAPMSAADRRLNPMRRRQRADLLLHEEPDLSRGSASTAGVFAKGDAAGSTVPFGEDTVEGLAFPALHMDATNTWRRSDGALREYIFTRLYSVDDRWRKDGDYVAFAAHRMAAHGDEQFAAFVKNDLPKPVLANVIHGHPTYHAIFARYEDDSENEGWWETRRH